MSTLPPPAKFPKFPINTFRPVDEDDPESMPANDYETVMREDFENASTFHKPIEEDVVNNFSFGDKLKQAQDKLETEKSDEPESWRSQSARFMLALKTPDDIEAWRQLFLDMGITPEQAISMYAGKYSHVWKREIHSPHHIHGHCQDLYYAYLKSQRDGTPSVNNEKDKKVSLRKDPEIIASKANLDALVEQYKIAIEQWNNCLSTAKAAHQALRTRKSQS